MKQTEAIDIQEYIDEKRLLVGQLLDEFIPPATQAPVSLHQAMRYSVLQQMYDRLFCNSLQRDYNSHLAHNQGMASNQQEGYNLIHPSQSHILW